MSHARPLRWKTSLLVLVYLASAACSGSTEDRVGDNLKKEIDAHFERTRVVMAQTDTYLASRLPSAGWTERSDRSRLTGDQEIVLSAQSQPYLGASGETRAALVVRCKERRKSVYLTWGEFLGHDDFRTETKEVLVRFDDARSERDALGVSTDNESVGWWESEQAESIIRRLSKASKVVARITPYDESPREAEFNVAGLDEFLPKLEAACPRRSHTRSGSQVQERAVEGN